MIETVTAKADAETLRTDRQVYFGNLLSFPFLRTDNG